MLRIKKDGRWKTFDDWKLAGKFLWPKLKSKVSAGLPLEMRRALEEAKRGTGLSMSEITRQCLAKGLKR